MSARQIFSLPSSDCVIPYIVAIKSSFVACSTEFCRITECGYCEELEFYDSMYLQCRNRRCRIMRAQVKKWGNSLALRIPKALAEEAGLDSGSNVELCSGKRPSLCHTRKATALHTRRTGGSDYAREPTRRNRHWTCRWQRGLVVWDVCAGTVSCKAHLECASVCLQCRNGKGTKYDCKGSEMGQ